MTSIRASYQYAKYVLNHKWHVFLAARRLGVPLWGALIHDWHKFLPDEFFPYAEWFYGYKGGSWYALKKQFKEQPTWAGDFGHLLRYESAFDMAWLLHQKRGPHHHQWWLLPLDDGGVKVLPMSDRYRREMLADWKGAGRAQGKPLTGEWYLANKAKMQLHPETRRWVEEELGVT